MRRGVFGAAIFAAITMASVAHATVWGLGMGGDFDDIPPNGYWGAGLSFDDANFTYSQKVGPEFPGDVYFWYEFSVPVLSGTYTSWTQWNGAEDENLKGSDLTFKAYQDGSTSYYEISGAGFDITQYGFPVIPDGDFQLHDMFSSLSPVTWAYAAKNVGYLNRFALVPSVPEPATWAMMIVGLAGVGAGLRRRRAAPVAA